MIKAKDVNIAAADTTRAIKVSIVLIPSKLISNLIELIEN